MMLDENFTIKPDGSIYDSYGDWEIDGVLMQFTGLTDKNGKEIYEGDVVRCGDVTPLPSWDGYGNDIPDPKSNVRTPIQVDIRIGVVVFNDGTPSMPKADRAEYVIKMWNGTFDFYHYKGVEVIGNVYANPEIPWEGKPCEQV